MNAEGLRMDEPRRLRVAHLSQSLEIGGQERLMVEFARHRDRERFDLHVISLSDRGKLAETFEAEGATVHTLQTPTGLKLSLLWRIRDLLRQLRIDIVHTHDDRPAIYGLPAAWWAGVRKRVHTHHHGEIAYISPRQNRMVAWAGRLADPFVCVSSNSAEFMALQGVPRDRVRTLRNGIDIRRFPYSGPDPRGAALTVARLSPEKDLANLLHAVAHLRPSIPGFLLRIAGDGPLRGDLQRLRDELQLRECVEFLGERRDIPELLAHAKLFILPSKTEGISLTILEAMARGLPVVTTRVGGNPEVVLEGETGLLVPSQDPRSLAEAIARIWADDAMGRRMGEQARLRVEKEFEIRAMVAQYEAIYQELPSIKK